LRAIDNTLKDLANEQFTERNFAPSEYTDTKGRRLRAYDLTRDGFSLIVMGFTGGARDLVKGAFWSAAIPTFRVHCRRAGLPVAVTRRRDGLMVKQRLLEPSEPSGRRTIPESSARPFR
jgi:Phage regulatory protein Rha (Phage_pRha)